MPEHLEKPEVRITGIQPVDASDLTQEAILRAPIIHLRKDTIGRFSDVPLLMYWEAEQRPQGRQVTYTVILSNEDGGTYTERLMARWGRTADIEWCYAASPSPKGRGARGEGKFFIVQSRPITALPPEPVSERAPHNIDLFQSQDKGESDEHKQASSDGAENLGGAPHDRGSSERAPHCQGDSPGRARRRTRGIRERRDNAA